MKNIRTTILVFATYLAGLSLCLLFWPSLFLSIGFETIPLPWVAITGYLLAVITFFYIMAVRADNRAFYKWTVYARLPLLPFALLLVLSGVAPTIMLLLGIVELLGRFGRQRRFVALFSLAVDRYGGAHKASSHYETTGKGFVTFLSYC